MTDDQEMVAIKEQKADAKRVDWARTTEIRTCFILSRLTEVFPITSYSFNSLPPSTLISRSSPDSLSIRAVGISNVISFLVSVLLIILLLAISYHPHRFHDSDNDH